MPSKEVQTILEQQGKILTHLEYLKEADVKTEKRIEDIKKFVDKRCEKVEKKLEAQHTTIGAKFDDHLKEAAKDHTALEKIKTRFYVSATVATTWLSSLTFGIWTLFRPK